MIGVIADDLTGAAELGAVGLRRGLRPVVLLTGGSFPDNADLICVDTDSRSCAAPEAARRAAAAAAMLAEHGARWIFKKTDSVLRGNVAREIEAVVQQLRLPGCLLVPANPSRGRTIAQGRCRIKGVPIHETDFRCDPEHPRLSDGVLEMLDRPLALGISIGSPRSTLPGSGIHVGEAATSADIRAWAARESNNRLLAGGADFFGALMGSPEVRVGKSVSWTKGLFVCGSASESTRTFVSSQASGGSPTFAITEDSLADDALMVRIRAAFRQHPRAILHGDLIKRGPAVAAARTMENLVRIAALVLRTTNVANVFAEGGTTAAALAREMGWSAMRVKSEAAPGVVTLAADATRLLTIKPGSYVWPHGS